jgi:murein DD-endopeptidase MepM/ murein hydrolase activator NlpD
VKQLAFALLLLLAPGCALADPVALDGDFMQGGLIVGYAPAGSEVTFEGREVRVGDDGVFLLGFGREAPPQAIVEITLPDGTIESRDLAIAQREYDIQHIEGLPDQMVTPDESLLARIAAERELILAAWAHDTPATDFLGGFVWPVIGPISGVYGSQRILNGEPRQPHFGVDMAAPEGTPVMAPAGGIVRLAEPDLYFTGGTIIVDHGHGLSSTLMHLASVDIAVAQRVEQGDIVGTVGATGRATGPHLDWRMNLYDARIDPQLLVPPMADIATTP